MGQEGLSGTVVIEVDEGTSSVVNVRLPKSHDMEVYFGVGLQGLVLEKDRSLTDRSTIPKSLHYTDFDS